MKIRNEDFWNGILVGFFLGGIAGIVILSLIIQGKL